MKKYTIKEAAKSIANKTHSIYCDIDEFDKLGVVLKLAFPNDEETYNFQFTKEDPYYGYCKHYSVNWANVGGYLEELEIINLSDILDYEEASEKIVIETVTISKEDYERFLKLESKQKKSDQKFLDKCAIVAMNGILSSYYGAGDVYSVVKNDPNKIAEFSFRLTKEMIKERKNQQNDN